MRGYLPKIENLHKLLYLMSFLEHKRRIFGRICCLVFFLTQQKGIGNEGVKATAEHVQKNKTLTTTGDLEYTSAQAGLTPQKKVSLKQCDGQ